MADGSIKRTMLILRALAMDGPQTLKQLSETVNYSPSTVLRFLRILQEEGYVEQDSNRIWRASLETWRMGAAVLAHGGWSRRLNEAVQEISRQTGETSIYSMYADGDIVYIALGASSHTVRTHIELGTRFHASEMTTGRAILGHLPDHEVDALMLAHWGTERWKGSEGDAFRRRLLEVRTRGYSSATSERWPGVWGIAAPVFDLDGRTIGALGLSIPPTREPENESELARLLTQHAMRLSGAAPR
ncbi:IclR family transcriptional regulator [Actinomadura sp. KC345]|uniref:IclR family transcriptional regulator n=1 Tax=Actinomadura sp. KC345 TaxID=2530371 RepID=UPI0014054E3C|nr:IclR family transcriptional regulator [Actinomadura sp. KC345]